MNSLKRYLLIITFLIIGVFFINIDVVDARSLDWHAVTVNCIYANGERFTYAYNNAKEQWTTAQSRYNLKGTDPQQNANSQATYLDNHPLVDSNYRCQKYVSSYVYPQVSKLKDNETAITFYKFGSSSDSSRLDPDDVLQRSGWCRFWGCEWAEAISIAETQQTNSLVSESYVFDDDVTIPNASIYYVRDDGDPRQAADVSGYVEIIVYDNAVFIQNNDYLARIGDGYGNFSGASRNSEGKVSGVPTYIYINEPEPKSSKDPNGSGGVAYSFNKDQTNYKVCANAPSSSGCKNRYKVTDEVFDPGAGSPGQVCDEMPETTKVLRDIIKYVQLLTPLLMIVLSGLDIGRIIFSGDLEKELPASKTRIIRRMIVGVSVFFLPLVISLLIDFYNQSGVDSEHQIKEIRCLFE